MSDTISRQAAIDAVDEALTRVFVEHRDIAEKMINKVPSAQPETSILTVTVNPDSEEIERVARKIKDAPVMVLPSAEPEIKPIDYQDCANAMLRMWMDEVITDGEYNRVMDKLNAFWRTRNERSD